MSKRQLEETFASRDALAAFRKDLGSYEGTMTVKAIVEGEPILEIQGVKIILESAQGEASGTGRINIFWEDSGVSDFSDRGLYGVYDVNYNVDIDYTGGVLTIEADDVVITLS